MGWEQICSSSLHSEYSLFTLLDLMGKPHVNNIDCWLQDGYELRKKFLIHVLKYHANEVEDNILEITRKYLERLVGGMA